MSSMAEEERKIQAEVKQKKAAEQKEERARQDRLNNNDPEEMAKQRAKLRETNPEKAQHFDEVDELLSDVAGESSPKIDATPLASSNEIKKAKAQAAAFGGDKPHSFDNLVPDNVPSKSSSSDGFSQEDFLNAFSENSPPEVKASSKPVSPKFSPQERLDRGDSSEVTRQRTTAAKQAVENQRRLDDSGSIKGKSPQISPDSPLFGSKTPGGQVGDMLTEMNDQSVRVPSRPATSLPKTTPLRSKSKVDPEVFIRGDLLRSKSKTVAKTPTIVSSEATNALKSTSNKSVKTALSNPRTWTHKIVPAAGIGAIGLLALGWATSSPAGGDSNSKANTIQGLHPGAGPLSKWYHGFSDFGSGWRGGVKTLKAIFDLPMETWVKKMKVHNWGTDDTNIFLAKQHEHLQKGPGGKNLPSLEKMEPFLREQLDSFAALPQTIAWDKPADAFIAIPPGSRKNPRLMFHGLQQQIASHPTDINLRRAAEIGKWEQSPDIAAKSILAHEFFELRAVTSNKLDTVFHETTGHSNISVLQAEHKMERLALPKQNRFLSNFRRQDKALLRRFTDTWSTDTAEADKHIRALVDLFQDELPMPKKSGVLDISNPSTLPSPGRPGVFTRIKGFFTKMKGRPSEWSSPWQGPTVTGPMSMAMAYTGKMGFAEQGGPHPNDPHPELSPPHAKDSLRLHKMAPSSLGLNEWDMYKYLTQPDRGESEFSQASAAAGTALHQMMQAQMMQAGTASEVEKFTADPTLGMAGFIDVVSPSGAIGDIKSLNIGKFAAVQERGWAYPKHLSQVRGYMGMTGNTSQPGFITYVQREDPSQQMTFKVPWSADKYLEDIEKLQRVRQRVYRGLDRGDLNMADLPKASSIESLIEQDAANQKDVATWANRTREFSQVYADQFKWLQSTSRGMPQRNKGRPARYNEQRNPRQHAPVLTVGLGQFLNDNISGSHNYGIN